MRAAIIGGGVIGGGWAARFLLMGWDVAVFDPDPQAKRKIQEVLNNARYALPMLYDTALPAEGALSFHDNLASAVADADWVQESVPERLDIKHATHDAIRSHTPKGAVVASSTSGFKPSELCESGAQVIVAHPFNPVYLLPLVELVGHQEQCDKAAAILRSLGMFPLTLRKEIDAHIADRLLEAVWREGLWLIKDGICTTAELDDAIRMGFGLRWAQMGLFETYRIAGGEAGMKHFMAQFGPALKWPWTKLMDVPEFNDDLVDLIAGQSDAQSGHLGIRDLERQRDNNLVAMMRALKGQGNAVGQILNDHDDSLRNPVQNVPLITVERNVPVDWADYNGHMNESRYGQVFSDAADAVLQAIGANADYIAQGHSYFTAQTNTKFIDETHVGAPIRCETLIALAEGKKLRLLHQMKHRDGRILASCDQFLLHVSLKTRKSCPPLPAVQTALKALAEQHRHHL